MTTRPEGHVHQQLAYGLRQPSSASPEPELVSAGITSKRHVGNLSASAKLGLAAAAALTLVLGVVVSIFATRGAATNDSSNGSSGYTEAERQYLAAVQSPSIDTWAPKVDDAYALSVGHRICDLVATGQYSPYQAAGEAAPELDVLNRAHVSAPATHWLCPEYAP